MYSLGVSVPGGRQVCPSGLVPALCPELPGRLWLLWTFALELVGWKMNTNYCLILEVKMLCSHKPLQELNSCLYQFSYGKIDFHYISFCLNSHFPRTYQ